MNFKRKHLDILQEAIGDVGYWNWWDEKLPEVFQLEFGNVLLYSYPEPGKPPGILIALRFNDPVSINFINRNLDGFNLDYKWPYLFKNENVGPFSLTCETLCFNNLISINGILNETETVQTHFGVKPDHKDFKFANIKMGFLAGPVGIIIAANDMRLFSQSGEIELNKIGDLYKKWWEYWDEYWKRKDTENPLPKDPICDVIFPVE